MAVASIKIEWRQLLIIAVVAVVFGGGAGYLGGRYSGGTGDTQIVTPRYSSAPSSPSQSDFLQDLDRMQEEAALERRLKCLERKTQQALNSIGSGPSVPCY